MDENPALRALARFHEPNAAERLGSIFARADRPAYFSNLTANVASVLDAVKPLTAASRVSKVTEMVSAVAPVALSAQTSAPMLNRKSAWDLYQYGTVPAALAAGGPSFKRSPGYLSLHSAAPVHGYGAVIKATDGRTTFDISAPATGLLDQRMPSVKRQAGAEGGVGSGAAQHAFGYVARPVTRDLHGFVRSPIADRVRPCAPWPGAAEIAGYVQTAGRRLQESTEAATRMFSASIADAPLRSERIAGPATAAGIESWAYSGISRASRFRHSPAHPQPRPRSPALDSLMDALKASAESAWVRPELLIGFDFIETEAEDLEVIEYPDQVEETEVEGVVGAQAFAEFYALLEARENQEDAEEILRIADLYEDLEHLRGIPALIAKGGPSRIHAALSANAVLKHLADRLHPPSADHHRDRMAHKYELGGKATTNRLIVLVDRGLPDISPKEYAEFVATIKLVGEWAGEGHHKPQGEPAERYAFRQLLRVLHFVLRAHCSLSG